MLYYIEVNLTCIVILLLFLAQTRHKQGDAPTDQLVLKSLLRFAVLFCTADLAAGVMRGQSFPGARTLIEISNLVYFEALAIISFLWFRFVELRRKPKAPPAPWKAALEWLPLAAFSLTAISNPFTHFLFSIDAGNLYVRGPGVVFHWLVVWLYFLVPTLRLLGMYMREKQAIRRSEIVPLLCFAIAPAIASVLQMLVYGVTSTQVGITVSIAMICLAQQNAQILTDPLTGLNNKRALERFMADVSQHDPETAYVIMMIDIDHFKAVNDRFGHLMGDHVLKAVANAVKAACCTVPGRMFLCRFGGDEFMIVGGDPGEEALAAIEAAILRELRRSAQEDALPGITVSVGVARGKGQEERDFQTLLEKADKAMYAVKAKPEKSRNPKK